MTIPLVLAVHIVLCMANTEPEPAASISTSVVEPEPSSEQATTSTEPATTTTVPASTSPLTSTTSPLTSTTGQVDTTSGTSIDIQVVRIDVKLSALTFENVAALVLAFQQALGNGANVSSASVAITIDSITVKVSYSGLPAVSGADLTQAVATAVNVTTQSVAVTIDANRRLSDASELRRLLTSVSASIAVASEANMDVVQKASQVMTASNNTGLLADQLTALTGNTVSPVTLTVQTLHALISVTSNITVGSGIQLNASAIKAHVQASVGGEVTVHQTGTMTESTTTPKLAAADTSFALSISPMIAIWVAAIAVVLS